MARLAVLLAAAAVACAEGLPADRPLQFFRGTRTRGLTPELLRVLAELLPSLGGAQDPPSAAPPPWPPQCNVSYLQVESALAFSYYAKTNAQCLADFRRCVDGEGTSTCDYHCTSYADTMTNQCQLSDDTPCSVTGANAKPADPTVPPYNFEYDLCLPNYMAPLGGCWEDAVPGLVAYFKWSLCGPSLESSPDCDVQVQCAFDHTQPFDPTGLIWGLVAAAAGCAGTFFVYRRVAARRAAALGISVDGEGEEDDADTDYVEAAAGGPQEDVSGAPPGVGASAGAVGGAGAGAGGNTGGGPAAAALSRLMALGGGAGRSGAAAARVTEGQGADPADNDDEDPHDRLIPIPGGVPTAGGGGKGGGGGGGFL